MSTPRERYQTEHENERERERERVNLNQESESSLPSHSVLMDVEENEVVEEPCPEQGEFESEEGDMENALSFENMAGFLVDEEKAPPSGFVISITRGGQCWRLHFAGGCWRIPGEHFKRFDDYGQVVPPESTYTHRCKDCFPVGIVSRQVEDAEAEMSGSSGSSSSSSSASGLADEASDS